MGIWNVFRTQPSKADGNFQNISAQDAHALIQEQRQNADFVILDVRTPSEFQQGHIAKSKNIDFYANTFRGALEKLDKDKTYLVYCRSGNRSGKTLKLMEQLGFQNAYNMLGGIGQWSAKQLPLTR